MAAALLAPAVAAAEEDPAVDIARLFGPRTVHLQTVGELFTDEQEPAATGSGLLVADDLVLTADHVVPEFGGQYRSTKLDVRVGSRFAEVRHGTVIARDSERDLALVQIDPVVSPRPYCPVAALAKTALTPKGARIYVLSYPLDEDASMLDGLIRNKPSDLQWTTNAALTSNDSGGPVFSSSGYLLGLARGGIVEWTNVDGVRSPVFSVNYIIPISNLSHAGIDAQIASHNGSDCWQMLTALLVRGPLTQPKQEAHLLAGTIDLGSLAGVVSDHVLTLPDVDAALTTDPQSQPQEPASPPPLPERLSRSFTIQQIKADHPVWPPKPTRRHYKPKAYKAQPGYRITQCNFAGVSVNNASNITCTVASDGATAAFSFDLESGPAFDRWRGWLHGAVVLRQELIH